MRACRSRGWPVCSKQALEIHVSVVRCRRSIHVLWRWGQRALPTIRRLRRSERATESMRNAPPMSWAIEARARTQPVRQIWVGQKLAANGNQIRIAFPEPCFRGKPSAATVRLMLSPSWRRHPRLQPLFGIRQHDGWTALGQTRTSMRAIATPDLPPVNGHRQPGRSSPKSATSEIAHYLSTVLARKGDPRAPPE